LPSTHQRYVAGNDVRVAVLKLSVGMIHRPNVERK